MRANVDTGAPWPDFCATFGLEALAVAGAMQ